MKKSYLLGIITGCCVTAILFLGYYAISNYFIEDDYPSAEANKQIATNIQDIKELNQFAENNLAEYSDYLEQARILLLSIEKREYPKNEIVNDIVKLTNEGLFLIESAKFNSIPIFTGENGEYRRIIPVTIDATSPTYKLIITSERFNREVINTFISNLSNNTCKYCINEIDHIISEVTMERARIEACQKKLTYSYEISIALSKSTISARKEELINILHKIKSDKLILSIQSANGIYTSDDRKQIQIQFDELNSEQNRLSRLLKKSINMPIQTSLLTQTDAEQAMLFLVKAK